MIEALRDRIPEFFKVSWMFYWRLTVVTLLTGSGLAPVLWAILPAAVLTLVAGFTLKTSPLKKLLKGRPIGYRIDHHSRVESEKAAQVSYEAEKVSREEYRKSSPVLKRATAPGRMTGYEPSALASYELQSHAHINGVPGKGLASSGFSEGNIQAGQAGELNFAKALQKQGIFENYVSFWSVAMISESGYGRDPELDTDVDVVLFDGRTILLIDVKNYKGGKITYKVAKHGSHKYLTATDDATGGRVEVSSSMSRNMELATERFSKRFAGQAEVRSLVVFMPQDNGEATVSHVEWPGRVPAYTLSELLNSLRMNSGLKANPHAQAVHSSLAGLLKK